MLQMETLKGGVIPLSLEFILIKKQRIILHKRISETTRIRIMPA